MYGDRREPHDQDSSHQFPSVCPGEPIFDCDLMQFVTDDEIESHTEEGEEQ